MLYESLFTYRERTLKKYTLDDVRTAAEARLNGKTMRVDALQPFSYTDRFTLVELNRIVEDIFFDTLLM